VVNTRRGGYGTVLRYRVASSKTEGPILEDRSLGESRMIYSREWQVVVKHRLGSYTTHTARKGGVIAITKAAAHQFECVDA
jgi:hypothetical protein